MGDHGDEAWDDLLFNEERYQDEQVADHKTDAYRYRHLTPRPSVRRDGLEDRFNIMTMEPVDNPQPEFHLLRVSALHRETQLAYLVTGTVEFNPPFRGAAVTELQEVWIPKSRCLVTGDAAQIPHWLLKKKMDYPNVIGAASVNLSVMRRLAAEVQKNERQRRDINPFG